MERFGNWGSFFYVNVCREVDVIYIVHGRDCVQTGATFGQGILLELKPPTPYSEQGALNMCLLF